MKWLTSIRLNYQYRCQAHMKKHYAAFVVPLGLFHCWLQQTGMDIVLENRLPLRTTEVEYHSNRKITTVRAALKQIVAYHAQGHTCHDDKVIQRIEGLGIEPGPKSNWNNELLLIPPTAPCISSCNIIVIVCPDRNTGYSLDYRSSC